MRNIYLTYDQWRANHPTLGTEMWNGFNKFQNIFMGVEKLSSSGTKSIVYENVGYTPEELRRLYEHHNDDKVLAKPFHPDDEDANLAAISYFKECVELTWLENKYKYLRLIQSLGFEYDPISNYDSHEWRHDMEDTNAGTHYENSSYTDSSTESTEADATNKPKTSHYTTTEESDTARLETYDETTGKTNGTSSLVHGAHTDKTKEHYDIYKKGNIGVMSTQDMLEQERAIARFSIVEEFFKDLNKSLALSVYKY